MDLCIGWVVLGVILYITWVPWTVYRSWVVRAINEWLLADLSC